MVTKKKDTKRREEVKKVSVDINKTLVVLIFNKLFFFKGHHDKEDKGFKNKHGHESHFSDSSKSGKSGGKHGGSEHGFSSGSGGGGGHGGGGKH